MIQKGKDGLIALFRGGANGESGQEKRKTKLRVNARRFRDNALKKG
jgi:hypothetical protein